MVEIIVIPSFFILLAVAQLLLAGLLLLADSKALTNRLVALLLALFAFGNLSLAIEAGALTLGEARPWVLLRLLFDLLSPPLLLLAGLSLLRPNWLRRRWLLWPLLGWMGLVPLALLADLTGLSLAVVKQSLLYQPPQGAGLPEALLLGPSVTRGLLAIPFDLSRLILPGLALFFPALFVALRERRRSPQAARLAWYLFAAIAVHLLARLLWPDLVSVLALAGFILGLAFAYLAFTASGAPLSLRRLAQVVGDLPMFSKLMLAIAVVVLPGILLFAVTSTSLLGDSIVAQVGDKLNGLAQAEARLVSAEIERQIANLGEVAGEGVYRVAVDSRQLSYSRLPEEAILQDIANKEELWVSGPPTQSLAVSLLNSQASQTLQQFVGLFPEYTAMFIVDRFGALVAANQRPEHYDYSSSDWFLPALNNGIGAIYAAPPLYDEALGQFIVEFVIPVHTFTLDDQVDGFLLTRYSLQNISAELERTIIGESGGTALFDRDYSWIPTPSAMTQGDPNLNWDLLLSSQQPWAILPYAGQESVVSWAGADDGYLGLQLVTYTPADEALASLGVARASALGVILFIILLALSFTVVLARLITRPLADLAEAAGRIRAGETGVQADVHGDDEIGALATAFNAMTIELDETISGLEDTVAARTRDLERRANYLQAAAEVGRTAAQFATLDELLNPIAVLISERFDYYHVGIFLLDETRQFAELRAANSEGGWRMISRGHRLKVGEQGIVGYVTASGKPHIEQSVEGEEAIHFRNPDLPDTRSEMALPLLAAGQLLGALDMQSSQERAFAEEDVAVLQLLADQVAIAINNLLLFQQAQESLEAERRAYGQLTRQAWAELLQGRHALSYRSTGDRLLSIDEPWRPASQQALQHAVVVESDDAGQDHHLAVPIKVRGDLVVGVLETQKPSAAGPWTQQEISLLEAVGDQLGVALENARLFEQSQRLAQRERVSADVAGRIWSSRDVESILQTTVQELGRALNASQGTIRLRFSDREGPDPDGGE